MLSDVFSTAILNPNKTHILPEETAAMFHLPPSELHPLVLVVVRQHSYINTAKILGMDEEEVEASVDDARVHLQKLIAERQIPTLVEMEAWKQESLILSPDVPEKEIAHGLAILYSIAAEKWIRMDLYNGGLLTGLATSGWTWQKDAGFTR
jgi:hypothetical protein